jgi:hypothetical protein
MFARRFTNLGAKSRRIIARNALCERREVEVELVSIRSRGDTDLNRG